MRALGRLLGPTFGVIAVLAHAVSIVLLAGVGALSDFMLVDAALALFYLRIFMRLLM